MELLKHVETAGIEAPAKAVVLFSEQGSRKCSWAATAAVARIDAAVQSHSDAAWILKLRQLKFIIFRYIQIFME